MATVTNIRPRRDELAEVHSAFELRLSNTTARQVESHVR
jgi:hypothetical protein